MKTNQHTALIASLQAGLAIAFTDAAEGFGLEDFTASVEAVKKDDGYVLTGLPAFKFGVVENGKQTTKHADIGFFIQFAGCQYDCTTQKYIWVGKEYAIRKHQVGVPSKHDRPLMFGFDFSGGVFWKEVDDRLSTEDNLVITDTVIKNTLAALDAEVRADLLDALFNKTAELIKEYEAKNHNHRAMRDLVWDGFSWGNSQTSFL